jgi:hypothetical protein
MSCLNTRGLQKSSDGRAVRIGGSTSVCSAVALRLNYESLKVQYFWKRIAENATAAIVASESGDSFQWVVMIPQ